MTKTPDLTEGKSIQLKRLHSMKDSAQSEQQKLKESTQPASETLIHLDQYLQEILES